MNTMLGALSQSQLKDLEADDAPARRLGWQGPVAQQPGLACVLRGRPHGADGKPLNATEVLALWERHGAALPQQLRGGFALALVDARRGQALLAVDRFSRETLCYRLTPGHLAFAERADRVPGRGSDLNLQAIYDYLLLHCIPSPQTVFADVLRLPPGHALLWERGEARLQSYWPLVFEEHQRLGFAEAKERFLGLIREGVAQELDGDARVGAFLSGGTDSSTVAGMLGQVSGRPAKTYSIGFEAEGYDEMAYARIAAQRFGCEHHEYYVTPADLRESIVAVAQHHDQPFGNSSALPAYYCARYARNDGCDKLLAGDGGDELFGGNSRYASQKFLNHYHALPLALRRLLEPLSGEDNPLRRIPGVRQALGYVRHSRQPMPDRLQSMNLLLQLGPQTLFEPGFWQRVDAQAPLRQMREVWGQAQAHSLINRMLAYDWRYTLAESDLPKVRGATQMAGVEVAYPLLSDELTTFSMMLEPDWKLRGYKLRWFFKEALRGFLPDEIIAKKKHGFGLPFGVWAHRDPGLARIMRDGLDSLAARRLIRPEFVRTLLDERLPEHPGYYGEMVWILLALEHWLQGQMPGYRLD